MRQWVLIAIALACRPRLLIADVIVTDVTVTDWIYAVVYDTTDDGTAEHATVSDSGVAILFDNLD